MILKHFNRIIKTNKENYLRFPGFIFVYISIEIGLRKLKYIGFAIDSIDENTFLGYKCSTVEIEILQRSSILIFLANMISHSLALKCINNYFEKYEDSKIVNTEFDNLELGEKVGYFRFDSRSHKSLYSATCADIVNYLVSVDFDIDIVKECQYSFPRHAYAITQYTKI